MKILQIAPAWESVPPKAYGGTEAVVHLLCEELVRQGHEVTLWASGDSITSARLKSCVPNSLRTASTSNKTPYSWQHAALALGNARDFDVIHNHGGEEVMALAGLVPDVPMLTSMHCLITPDTKFIWDHYKGSYNTISYSQKRHMPSISGARYAGVAYNGIHVESFPFQAQKDDYLLFLARISMEKGAHIAIEVAKQAGRRLVIAGKVDAADYEYYVNYVAPLIDGEQVVMVGEAGGELKRELYRNAYAVVMPIVWDEPFGLVMAEAGACGTPVVVFNRGAAPEIVQRGETGFVVDTVEQMVDAIGRVGEINPYDCRRWIADQFGGERMARRYLELFQEIARDSTPRPAAPRELAWASSNGNGHRYEAEVPERVA